MFYQLKCSDSPNETFIYFANIGTPHATGACCPSLYTRFPLTKVAKTFPDNLFPI